MSEIKILNTDVIAGLKSLPEKSVHCVVTSPPYWGLRDYGVEGQIGLEKTPEEYLEKMVQVFREVRRVLRDDGTAWVNMGDNYATGGYEPHDKGAALNGYDCPAGWAAASRGQGAMKIAGVGGLKQKDLVGMPWRLAFALQQPYIVPTCVKSEVDRAWLASLFDGEGCIGIRRFNSYRKEVQQVYQDGFVVYTVVTNNDVELLNRCIEITGKGRVALKQKANTEDKRGVCTRHDSYGWRLDGNDAIEVIKAIYPYLITKKRQACLAYSLDKIHKNKRRVDGKVPKEIQDKKTLLYSLIKSCNQREGVKIPDWVEEPKQDVEPGWYLRSDIIWSKPNPMPESVTDRPTKAHEYIFLLTKKARYFYDADAVRETAEYGRSAGGDLFGRVREADPNDARGNNKGAHYQYDPATGRNRRTVWEIPTQPTPEAHFATFPEALVEPCIKAGTSERGCCSACGAPWVRVVEKGESMWKNTEVTDTHRPSENAGFNYSSKVDGKTISGKLYAEWKKKHPDILKDWQPTCTCNAETIPCTVLDPFGGSGTVAKVARDLKRDAIIIELNPAYVEIARRKLRANEQLFEAVKVITA